MKENAAPRVAVVTGGSRGIGRAIVLQLARDGFDLAFCYKDSQDKAEAVRDEVTALGRAAFVSRCDVSDMDSVREFLATAASRLGPVYLLVNNAGIIRDRALAMMTTEEWADVLATNLDGVFNFCRSVVFEFIKAKAGRIINVASIAGIFGNASQTNYSAAKAGIIGFSKALAKEIGRFDVSVNVVAPGFIETDMTAALGEKQLQEILRRSSLKRLGSAQDVADLVSFLASDRATFITGQVIQVDGGQVI